MLVAAAAAPLLNFAGLFKRACVLPLVRTTTPRRRAGDERPQKDASDRQAVTCLLHLAKLDGRLERILIVQIGRSSELTCLPLGNAKCEIGELSEPIDLLACVCQTTGGQEDESCRTHGVQLRGTRGLLGGISRRAEWRSGLSLQAHQVGPFSRLRSSPRSPVGFGRIGTEFSVCGYLAFSPPLCVSPSWQVSREYIELGGGGCLAELVALAFQWPARCDARRMKSGAGQSLEIGPFNAPPSAHSSAALPSQSTFA